MTAGATPAVLLVDPDPRERARLARELEGCGWCVWAVPDAASYHVVVGHEGFFDDPVVDKPAQTDTFLVVNGLPEGVYHAYGQRYARHWLDLVRYTDSYDARGTGGPKDCSEAWRYRDWVVDALNQDLPYDQFITQQIAGDLLPPSSILHPPSSCLTSWAPLAVGSSSRSTFPRR